MNLQLCIKRLGFPPPVKKVKADIQYLVTFISIQKSKNQYNFFNYLNKYLNKNNAVVLTFFVVALKQIIYNLIYNDFC